MLQSLYLFQFKNYLERNFDFGQKIHCFWGENGTGKTNILDAIYYLCFTKSYFTHTDSKVILNGAQSMRILGNWDKHTVNCVIRENGKKEFQHNGIAYEKFSAHIGLFPAVMISPDDTILISGHSDVRRKFLDIILSQLNPAYLSRLIIYNKQLAQRNAYLKSIRYAAFDSSLLNTYNEDLILHGEYICVQRKELTQEILKHTAHFYNIISGEKEQIDICYDSSLLQNNFRTLLKENEEKDFFMQRTTSGIHKDDVDFLLDGMPFKQQASQGQRKSFLFAIKFAEFAILSARLNKKTILLLDDFFEKLDEQRSQRLVDLIVSFDTQLFVTDTDETRLRKAFEPYSEDIAFEKII